MFAECQHSSKQNVSSMFSFLFYLFFRPQIDLGAQAVTQRCSLEKVLLKISQNSQENTSVEVALLLKLQASATILKKKHQHRCCPENSPIFLKMHLLIEHLWWLLLSIQSIMALVMGTSKLITYKSSNRNIKPDLKSLFQRKQVGITSKAV